MSKRKQYILPFNPKSVSIQGESGSFSNMAVINLFGENVRLIENGNFPDAFAKIGGDADLGVIPIDNTIAGEVPYVHNLIRSGAFHVWGETFVKIEHTLVGIQGARISDIDTVHSHVHALAQCSTFFNRHSNLRKQVHEDTAGAARHVSEMQDVTQAAVSSTLAAELYGLNVLEREIQSEKRNFTRFLVLSKRPYDFKYDSDNYISSFVVQVKPDAKAAQERLLLAFNMNGAPRVRLHNYLGRDFNESSFYLEVLGHIKSDKVQAALKEADPLVREMRHIGTFPKHPFRVPNRRVH